MSGFSADWLKLREGADLAARDPHLARRFAAALSRRPGQPLRLLDLGAGTGANCRALLPRIGGNQDWVLIERARDLIAAQAEAFTVWARRQGYPILAGGGRIAITAGTATWNVTSLPLDLVREEDALAALEADGVTASALFDLVSNGWVTRFAALLGRKAPPLLAVLTVDGRRLWQPPLAEDEIVAAGFRRHQQRDKGFGAALGGDAPRLLAQALTAHGFTVATAVSDWRLGSADSLLLDALVEGEAEAAQAASPADAAAIAAWREQRQAQLRDRKLTLTLGHCDLLALPG